MVFHIYVLVYRGRHVDLPANEQADCEDSPLLVGNIWKQLFQLRNEGYPLLGDSEIYKTIINSIVRCKLQGSDFKISEVYIKIDVKHKVRTWMAFHPGRPDFVLTECNMHNESDSWYRFRFSSWLTWRCPACPFLKSGSMKKYGKNHPIDWSKNTATLTLPPKGRGAF